MRRLVGVTVLLATLAACQPASVASPYAKARVFFLGWDLMTRHRLSPEDVRRLAPSPPFSTTDASEINALVLRLRPEALVPDDGANEDARLVVDLVLKNGQEVTYFASYFSLVAPAIHQKHPIDDAFRSRFRVGQSPSF